MADFDTSVLEYLGTFAIEGFKAGFVLYFACWCTAKMFYIARKIMTSR